MARIPFNPDNVVFNTETQQWEPYNNIHPGDDPLFAIATVGKAVGNVASTVGKAVGKGLFWTAIAAVAIPAYLMTDQKKLKEKMEAENLERQMQYEKYRDEVIKRIQNAANTK